MLMTVNCMSRVENNQNIMCTPETPKEGRRDGGHLELPRTETKMQTPSRWARREEMWRDSPTNETHRGS
ncbi:hypothetical protein DPMN_047995 [Dreissena polymorpha]|uniref:Uncharacterized protein n=1 Tax=Dreissena polymorpha TaxID=45954 RepID=A0A9D4DCH0_DREPO|nr:hypothetical protein DPMN_047995 [Dreissena polymorpha]